jgi:hypothetical protein
LILAPQPERAAAPRSSHLVRGFFFGGSSFGAGYLTFASKDQELKVHLVEIAIGILRADPKEDVTPARGWARDIIEKNSGVPSPNKTERPFCTSLCQRRSPYWGMGGSRVWTVSPACWEQ